MLSLWLALQLATASLPQVPSDRRLEQLTAWLAAVERHEPGTVDAPALVIRWWDRGALAAVHQDMFALTTLIRDRGAQMIEALDRDRARRLHGRYIEWELCRSSARRRAHDDVDADRSS